LSSTKKLEAELAYEKKMRIYWMQQAQAQAQLKQEAEVKAQEQLCTPGRKRKMEDSEAEWIEKPRSGRKRKTPARHSGSGSGAGKTATTPRKRSKDVAVDAAAHVWKSQTCAEIPSGTANIAESAQGSSAAENLDGTDANHAQARIE